MTKLLFQAPPCGSDPFYQALWESTSPVDHGIRTQIEEMWQAYQSYADRDFRSAFPLAAEERAWELMLGYALLTAGKKLLPTIERPKKSAFPDICVLQGGSRIWIEAIAPKAGADGPDQVVGPRPINEGGKLGAVPQRQAQLRITGAFAEKSKKFSTYVEKGVVKANEVKVIAIGGGAFGIHIPGDDLPLILSSLLPMGDEQVRVDLATGVVMDSHFLHSPTVEKHKTSGVIPRNAFATAEHFHVSAAVWSRLSLGAMSRKVRPITLVHNPFAEVPMLSQWGVWDKEYVVTVKDDGIEFRNILAPSK